MSAREIDYWLNWTPQSEQPEPALKLVPKAPETKPQPQPRRAPDVGIRLTKDSSFDEVSEYTRRQLRHDEGRCVECGGRVFVRVGSGPEMCARCFPLDLDDAETEAPVAEPGAVDLRERGWIVFDSARLQRQVLLLRDERVNVAAIPEPWRRLTTFTMPECLAILQRPETLEAVTTVKAAFPGAPLTGIADAQPDSGFAPTYKR